MKTAAILYIMGFSLAVSAQDTLTLYECQQLAKEMAPRLADLEYIRQIGQLNSAQAGTGWFPSLDLNGKLSYQSDVVTVALTDPTIPVSFPEVPHDQYGLNLDIRQTLYDGGISRQRKALEEARTAADLQQVEVDLYALKSRVNQYYFAILLLQENRKNLEVHMDNLLSRKESMATAIQGGVLLQADMKVIDVEILRIKQSMVEVDARKKSMLEALKVLCGTAVEDGSTLVLPDMKEIGESPVNRPEYRLFELKDASLEAGKELAGRKRMPVVFAYGQTGYGKPGYNMLSGEWDFYYMVGAGLKWNIWDWSSTSREKQVIENRQQVLQHQRASFDREVETLLVQEAARIEQYRQAMELEAQVLALREEISGQAASELSNGTITATDYITELNKESLARISLSTNGILLNQAIVNYLTIQGNL
jgi:outer membrane protein TolC